MPGIHFKYSYNSLSGQSFTVEVYDSVTVSPPDYTINGDAAAEISYEGAEMLHPFSKVLGSNCVARVRISNDTEQGYLNTIINGLEDQFYLILKKGSTVIWRGMLLKDMIEVQRQSYPYSVTLNATDGLKRLGDIKIAIPTSGSQNLVRLLNDLLSETKIQKANFGGSDAFLTTSVRYFEISMHDVYANSTDPLRYAKLYNAQRLYRKTSTGSTVEYESYLTTLEDLCRVFGMRIFMRNGHFYAVQVDAWSESKLKLHSYTYDATFNSPPTTLASGTASYAAFNHAESIASSGEVLTGEFFQFAPPIRQTRMKVVNLENKEVLKPSYFNGLSALTTLGDVVSGGFSTGVRIRLNLFMSLTRVSWPVNFLLEWQFVINIGSHYYTNQGGAPRWTTTATDYYSVQQIHPSPGGSPAIFTLPGGNGAWFDIITNNLPATGSLSIQVKALVLDLSQNGLGSTTVNSVDGSIAVDYYNYNAITAPDDEVQLVYGTNTNSSYVLDFGETPINDDRDTVYNGKLMINTGSVWQDTKTWRRFSGKGASGTLANVVIASAYRLQQSSAHIFNGGIINPDIDPLRTLTIDSMKFLMQRATYKTGLDEWHGAWISLGTYDGLAVGSDLHYYDNIGQVAMGMRSNNGGMIDSGYRITSQFLELTRTTMAVSGTLTSITVDEAEANIANSGDKVLIVNPYNGEQEEITLNAAWESGAGSISFSSYSFTRSFPEGSLIALPLKNVASRLFALENP